MALLTSRTLATGVTGTDLIHIVITGDTSQNPAGSSYKAEIDQVKNYLSNYFISSTGNTSASCITDLYVTNVYGCSPITIHDSVQSVGSSSTGITSFSFGNGVSAFGDYSHSEGENTLSQGVSSHSEGVGSRSYGDFSHAEGSNTLTRGVYSHSEGVGTTTYGESSHSEGNGTSTGQYGYISNSIVNGVIDLDVSYGDVTSEFASGYIVLDDFFYDSNYGVEAFSIQSISFTTNTTITLYDSSVNTTQAIIGDLGKTGPVGADQLLGGYYSHSEGESTISVGISSHSQGSKTTSVGKYSFASGVESSALGSNSFIHSDSSTVSGKNSVVLGGTGLNGNNPNTVYVPYLNIRDLGV